MPIWLLKTEPDDYSLNDLKRDGTVIWDGVANNLALKYMRQMKVGDTALIYHTGVEKAVMGAARVTSKAYANPHTGDPRLVVVDLKFSQAFASPVTLQKIKSDPHLAGWELVRIPRLSVMPVTAGQWKILKSIISSMSCI